MLKEGKFTPSLGTSICHGSGPRKGKKTKKKKKRKKERKEKEGKFGRSHCGSEETNLTSIHEEASYIPGPTQWVKDPVLLPAVV